MPVPRASAFVRARAVEARSESPSPPPSLAEPPADPVAEHHFESEREREDELGPEQEHELESNQEREDELLPDSVLVHAEAVAAANAAAAVAAERSAPAPMRSVTKRIQKRTTQRMDGRYTLVARSAAGRSTQTGRVAPSVLSESMQKRGRASVKRGAVRTRSRIRSRVGASGSGKRK